jgi:hypothetical protein
VVEVVLQESILCPRCEKLRPILERVCDMLNIPLIRREVDIDPYIWGRDSVSETFRKEFIEKHKPELAGDPFAMAVASRLSKSVHTPVVVVSSTVGDKPVQIVIRGFPTSYSPETRRFEANLYALLRGLKEAERRRSLGLG